MSKKSRRALFSRDSSAPASPCMAKSDVHQPCLLSLGWTLMTGRRRQLEMCFGKHCCCLWNKKKKKISDSGKKRKSGDIKGSLLIYSNSSGEALGSGFSKSSKSLCKSVWFRTESRRGFPRCVLWQRTPFKMRVPAYVVWKYRRKCTYAGGGKLQYHPHTNTQKWLTS